MISLLRIDRSQHKRCRLSVFYRELVAGPLLSAICLEALDHIEAGFHRNINIVFHTHALYKSINGKERYRCLVHLIGKDRRIYHISDRQRIRVDELAEFCFIFHLLESLRYRRSLVDIEHIPDTEERGGNFR